MWLGDGVCVGGWRGCARGRWKDTAVAAVIGRKLENGDVVAENTKADNVKA